VKTGVFQYLNNPVHGVVVVASRDGASRGIDMSSIKKPMLITCWVLQVVVIAIFAMAAMPKLTGDEGSKALFEVLGAEPMGRIAVGIAELIAIVLLLIPRLNAIGAVFSIGVIGGAIMSHLTKLGISIDATALESPALVAAELEGPAMFIMAVIVLVASLGIVVIRRSQLPIVGAKFASPAHDSSGESA